MLELFFSKLFLFFSGQNVFFLFGHVFLGQPKGGFMFFLGRFFCTMATILRSYRWSRCQCSVPGHCRLLLPRPHTRTLGPVPLWTSAVACCVAPGSVVVVPPTRLNNAGTHIKQCTKGTSEQVNKEEKKKKART